MHVLVGVVNSNDEQSMRAAWNCYEKNLLWLASTMKTEAIDWLIEPINRFDVPGYLLSRQADAHELLSRLNQPNLGVQMDLYHCLRTEGEVLNALSEHLPSGRVKHMQLAGKPSSWPKTNQPRVAGLAGSLKLAVCRLAGWPDG